MGHTYVAVGWNRQKRIYDRTLALAVLLSLGVFVGVGAALFPNTTAETLLIRGLGTTALVLLHVVLSIGPLARLDRRFLPLLYNRRHLGVTMFVLALAHGALSLIQFHALGDMDPLASLFASSTHTGSVAWFPFQPLGFVALMILFVMAATSHDFWLAFLTAPVWKALHMLVYVAWALLVLHVALGSLQVEASPVGPALLLVGALWVSGLHLIAGRREAADDREASARTDDGRIDVGQLSEITDGCAKIVTVEGERVAVFRDGDSVFALSNACQHQNGPLGEGRLIDGCVTCPWHGYQYDPATGRSPPPFTEAVPTFGVEVIDGNVLLDPHPRAAVVVRGEHSEAGT